MESFNSDSQQTTNKKDLQSPFESSNDEENDSDENSSKDGLQIEVLGEQYKEYDNSYKIIVVGNSGVGKSCLSLKATKGLFEEEFLSTMGFEFYSFYIKINKSIVKLQIWDTCGQEVYRSLISNFYRNSSVAILVYAINDRKSFEDIDVWTKQIKNLSSPDCKVFLIGNKADLVDSRKVTKEEGKNCKKKNLFNLFMETSAKTGLNARKLFITAARILYLENLKYNEDDNAGLKGKESKILDSISKTIELNQMGNEDEENEGCC